MSQTDEQIRPTLDALVERLRTSVSDQVSVAAEQLLDSVSVARQAAVRTLFSRRLSPQSATLRPG